MLSARHNRTGSHKREDGNTLPKMDEPCPENVLCFQHTFPQQPAESDCHDDVAARLHAPEGLGVKVVAPDRQPPFAPPIVEAICQIAYEAVSNIIRHTEATEATIEATEDVGLFRLFIGDKGRGFSPDKPSEHDGLGLRNMTRRARIYGGAVNVESTPGKGTRLRVEIPLKP
jgi:signal transduction histidine kinase